MDDIWHRIGRVFRISNLGTLIFFLLNMSLVLAIFCPNGVTAETAFPLILIYIASVLISLSPLGEWVFAALAGAREIKQIDVKIRLIPLLEIVFDRAKRRNPTMVNSIRLKIMHDATPNAFAIGRKTICVTEGLLELSDQEIMAVLAHEVGHLVYHHSALQLLIGGGNLFITGLLLLVKAICWMITGICTLVGLTTRRFWGVLLLTVFGSLSSALIWLWTKFCTIFLRWSMRQNEYIADEYAFYLGFGQTLASVLDTSLSSNPENGLLKALYATHPSNEDRVSRLRQLGAEYSQY